MKSIFIPEYIRSFVCLLENAGYEAYLVGGCVRDAIMGKEINDYDLTTSATPDEMKEVFEGHYKIAETGIKHGTLTVISNDGIAEITTFRVDGEYTDGRHPDGVCFTRVLENDLARRDFTVNALAYNEKSGITDLFGGISDIENKVIRAVGHPEKRFSEDALRILRAVRFSAALGFDIDEETAQAMLNLKDNLRLVARERVYAELKKTVMGRNAAEVINKFSPIISGVLEGFDKTELLKDHDGQNEYVRAALLSDGFKTPSAAKKALSSLKPDNKTKTIVSKLIDVLDGYRELDGYRIIDYAVKNGLNTARLAIETLRVKSPEIGANAERTLNAAIQNGYCLELKYLRISGKDMISLGCPERYIGEALERILCMTSHGILTNTRARLLEEAEKIVSEIHE